MVGFTNRIRDLRKKLRVRWRLAGLATKFLIMAIPPVVCNSLLLGAWVSREVQEGVVQDEAAAGALYVEALLEPVLRRMSSTETASAAAIEALNDLAASKPFRERIANYKVWSLDGRILFSKAPELIGRTYPLGDRLREALTGKVTAEYDELSDEENTWERDLQKPLLEIYVPIRALDTGRVVAVAEIYQFAGELESELRAVRFKTWAIVATLTTAMVGPALLLPGPTVAAGGNFNSTVHFAGRIACVVTTNVVQSPAVVDAMRTFLAAKYGVSVD